MSDYFFSPDGTNQQGPIPREEFLRRVASGEIRPDWLAWREGLPDWTRVSELPDAGSTAPQTSAPAEPPVAVPTPVVFSPPAAMNPPIQAGPLGPSRSGSGEGLAVASLVLGIVGLLTSLGCGFVSLPLALTGLILGVVSKAHGGMRVAGIVLNVFGLLISLGWVVLMIIGAVSP